MRRKPHSRRRRQGFTLMEVLLVVAILIILASLATVSITNVLRGTRPKEAKLNIDAIEKGLQGYYIDIGTYPQSLQDLVSLPQGLADETKWNGPYLSKGLPQDPWSRDFEYSVENEQYVVWSNGPNGVANDGDDISSSK